MSLNDTTNDTPKLCECGCGQPAPIAKRNDPETGAIKGQPQRFVVGHWARVQPRQSIDERFWGFVDMRGPDECWPWKGGMLKSGYGRIGWNGKAMRAHRVSYELHYGPIPDNLMICHRCDNPACVNPSHLFMGTQHENILDKEAKGRHGPGRGERNHAKLTEADVIRLRQLHAEGATLLALSKGFGIDRKTVWDITHRKKWRHVP